MDDIAKASGVARTALYKTYRNKEHIFRALAEQVHSQALLKAESELSGEGLFRQRLANALILRDTHLLKIGHSGPHADEIADLYHTLAGDLAVEFNAKLVDLMVGAINGACASNAFQLPDAYASSNDLAHLLRLALEGVKKEVKSVVEFEQLARQLIDVMT